MRAKVVAAVVAAIVIAVAVPLFAHHAFSAEYDNSKPITVKGKFTKMDWVNPHSWVHLDVVMPDGKTLTWAAETPPPNVLYRQGWRKDTLKAGQDVEIRGFLLKGRKRAHVGANRDRRPDRADRADDVRSQSQHQMRTTLILSVFAAAVAALGIDSIPAAAQQAANIPRMPDGKPDLQGIWQAMSTAAWDIEPHHASYGIPAGLGVIVDPPDGKIPYLPAAAAKRQANFKNRAAADSFNKCFMPGIPRLTYLPYPFQIIQTPKYLMAVYEYNHIYRTIYLDGSKHPDGLDFWNGDSRARWEGDSLVVDVANFNDQTWFDASGNHHSEAMHVVERYSFSDRDTLTYEATIEDPRVFSRPWKISLPLYRHKERNFRLLEYECAYHAEQEAGK